MEPIYIKIYKNHIKIRDLHSQKEASVQRDFSHSRMLIGDFYPAIEAIRIALKDLGIHPSSFFVKKKCDYSPFGKNRKWVIKGGNSLI